MKTPLLIGVTSLGMLVGTAVAEPLELRIEGVEARGGTLLVSVQNEAEFMGETGIAGDVVEAPEAGTATFSFDVPPGDYAVTVWHDDNGNGQFDRAEIGYPLDGWAMSGTMPERRGPTFAEAAVRVPAGGGTTTVSMTYGR